VAEQLHSIACGGRVQMHSVMRRMPDECISLAQCTIALEV